MMTDYYNPEEYTATCGTLVLPGYGLFSCYIINNPNNEERFDENTRRLDVRINMYVDLHGNIYQNEATEPLDQAIEFIKDDFSVYEEICERIDVDHE